MNTIIDATNLFHCLESDPRYVNPDVPTANIGRTLNAGSMPALPPGLIFSPAHEPQVYVAETFTRWPLSAPSRLQNPIGWMNLLPVPDAGQILPSQRKFGWMRDAPDRSWVVKPFLSFFLVKGLPALVTHSSGDRKI